MSVFAVTAPTSWFFWKALFTVIICTLWIYAAWRFGLKNKQVVRADNPLAYGGVGFNTTLPSFWAMCACLLGAVATFALVFITVDSPTPHTITKPTTSVYIDVRQLDPKKEASKMKREEEKAYKDRVSQQNKAYQSAYDKAAKRSKEIIQLHPTIESPTRDRFKSSPTSRPSK